MPPTADTLKEAFRYYLDNQSEFVRDHKGRYIVIKGTKVLGHYASEIEAIKTTSKKHELGTFLVQLVEEGDDSYSETFHSRVSFA